MQGEYRQCKSCGQIYHYNGQPLCAACVLKTDQEFKRIKEYLYENPGASVAQVVEATGVDEKTVLYLLKEGRLEMKSAAGFLVCLSCGEPIRSGTMCAKCAKKLSSAFESVTEKKRPAGRRGMEDEGRRGRMHTDKSRKQF
jgi:predicted amidophosphoribosyltransferase